MQANRRRLCLAHSSITQKLQDDTKSNPCGGVKGYGENPAEYTLKMMFILVLENTQILYLRRYMNLLYLTGQQVAIFLNVDLRFN